MYKKAHRKAIGELGPFPIIHPIPQKSTPEAHLKSQGRNRGALQPFSTSMRPYSVPVIRRFNDKKWYVEFWFDIPPYLRNDSVRKRKRFRKYGEINKLEGEEREKYAKDLCEFWDYALKISKYNPFDEEADILEYTLELENMSESALRENTSIQKCLALFYQSRAERTNNTNSLSTVNGTIKWLTEYFTSKGMLDAPIVSVTRLHISEALSKAKTRIKKDGTKLKWSNTTYNKELDNAMTLFNWLEREEYIPRNPALRKIEKLRTQKTMHTWYDKQAAIDIKTALLADNQIAVYRACQFTYWLMVRSQSELMKLLVSDIDRTLKRVRFRPEVSKNGVEEFREYPNEFEAILDEMNFDSLPKDWYVFGTGGLPSAKRSGKNELARKFKKVKDSIGFSKDYTIYGWKHTRICHLMMLGVDGYDISYMARHKDPQSTEAYKRDYDFTLKHVYDAKDLTF